MAGNVQEANVDMESCIDVVTMACGEHGDTLGESLSFDGSSRLLVEACCSRGLRDVPSAGAKATPSSFAE